MIYQEAEALLKELESAAVADFNADAHDSAQWIPAANRLNEVRDTLLRKLVTDS